MLNQYILIAYLFVFQFSMLNWSYQFYLLLILFMPIFKTTIFLELCLISYSIAALYYEFKIPILSHSFDYRRYTVLLQLKSGKNCLLNTARLNFHSWCSPSIYFTGRKRRDVGAWGADVIRRNCCHNHIKIPNMHVKLGYDGCVSYGRGRGGTTHWGVMGVMGGDGH